MRKMRLFPWVVAWSLISIGCNATHQGSMMRALGQDMILSGAGSPAKVTSAPSYQGPGDVVSGAYAWWGFRAYNAAYATAHGNVVQVCNSSGTGCINITANTNGTITAPSGIACGGSACTLVTTLYDQSGGNNCSGGPCNMVQATTVNMPTFNGTGVISMTVSGGFSGSGTFLQTGGGLTLSQPFTDVAIANRQVNTGANPNFLLDSSTANGVFLIAPNKIRDSLSGINSTNSITIGTPFALASTVNSAGGTLNLDGTATAGASDSTFTFSSAPAALVNNNSTDTVTISEAGFWAGDQTSHLAALITNMQGYCTSVGGTC